ncbi:YegS/Rv2252/BmrU family lipid kinase [Lysinibacillus sp. KU-BSD001]|uniref:diacylglycerol/lipid kinase family protein n=1 Tax=Lysinibacillus sp. KU-BSD001 TaxID=3141328 RepID=UPI0036E03F6D
MKLAFIINEFAGNGKGRRIWKNIERKLTVPYEAYISHYPKHAFLLARELAERAANDKQQVLLIVIGGDGTVHEVVNGCVNCNYIILGNIRAGSGNDFARGFFAFRNAQEIASFLHKPNVRKIDIGHIQCPNEHFFVNNCGIGFDAFVGIKANKSNIKKWLNKIGMGKLSYVYYVVLGLFMFKPFSLTVQHGGQTLHYDQVWFATVSNQPYFGGGMKISPHSITADGKLELTIVHKLSRLKFLTIFMTVFLGVHTRFSQVAQMSGATFRFQGDRMLPCHADGEEINDHGLALNVNVRPTVIKIAERLSD